MINRYGPKKNYFVYRSNVISNGWFDVSQTYLPNNAVATAPTIPNFARMIAIWVTSFGASETLQRSFASYTRSFQQ